MQLNLTNHAWQIIQLISLNDDMSIEDVISECFDDALTEWMKQHCIEMAEEITQRDMKQLQG